MPVKSISQRLIVAATLWIVCALAITAVFLTAQFRNHVERAIDMDLQDHISEILTLVAVDAEGRARLSRHPVDPRFNEAASGWYWEIRFGDDRTERSRSLDGGTLQLPGRFERGVVTLTAAQGPRGRPLRVAGQLFQLPGAKAPFAILLAGPAADLAGAAREFSLILTAALAALAVGLVLAVILQVRFGLRPLERMRASLAHMRGGDGKARMDGPFPAEIQPLADELNALLDHSAAVLERARTQTGDLAHALKTPLAVIRNEADRLDGEAGAVIRLQTERMADRVDHILTRARMAGARRVLGVRTDVDAVVQGLRRTLKKIFGERPIEIEVEGIGGLAFEGERQDLEELLGNLMDNACKWAEKRVVVWGRRDGTHLLIGVDDDGPGIAEDRYDEVLGRGGRLDDRVPGSGLGLSIVCDVAATYDGSLSLTRSGLGGLSARVRLPAI